MSGRTPREPPIRPTREITRDYWDEQGNVETRTHIEPVPPRRRPPAKQKGFMMVWRKKLKDISLSANEWRVFWALTDLAEYGTGVVRYRLKDIAVSDAASANVQASQCVAALVESGLIFRLDRGIVKINPEYVWIGDQEDRKKALESMGITETEIA